MPASPDHIHTPHDGRGLRKVLVNGKEVQECYFADTRRGVARCYREPIRMHKYAKRALTKTYRGQVQVLPLE